MKQKLRTNTHLGAILWFAALPLAMCAQQSPIFEGTELGFGLFQERCMGCHGNPAVERAPSPAAIRQMPPERIYDALTSGVMKTQGGSLSDEQKRKSALFMSGRPLGSAREGDAKNMPNGCTVNPPLADPASGPEWN